MSRTTRKGRKKHATAVNNRVATLETELTTAKALHSRLLEVSTRSEADANKTRTNLQDAQARLVEVEQKEELTRKGLDEI